MPRAPRQLFLHTSSIFLRPLAPSKSYRPDHEVPHDPPTYRLELVHKIQYEGSHERRGGGALQVSLRREGDTQYVILIEQSATIKGGSIGGLIGTAVGAGAVIAASRRYHSFRALTVPFRAFLVASTGTFIGRYSLVHTHGRKQKLTELPYSRHRRRPSLGRIRHRTHTPKEASSRARKGARGPLRIQQHRLPARQRMGNRQPVPAPLRLLDRLDGRLVASG
jgi:hypothetical protein